MNVQNWNFNYPGITFSEERVRPNFKLVKNARYFWLDTWSRSSRDVQVVVISLWDF